MESITVSQFTTLGHPQRLAVFRLLMRHYPEPIAAGDIGAALGIKPSTLSVYLGALRRAGLIFTTPNVRGFVLGNYIDHCFIELSNEYDENPNSGSSYTFGGLTISAGVSTLRGAEDTAQELLRRGDMALYQAKREGRNCVVVQA